MTQLVFDIVTLFPAMVLGVLHEGALARARKRDLVAVRVHDLRRWGLGPHRQVDDEPYGGGGGMVLRPEPFFEAVAWIRERYPAEGDRVVLLSPQGRRFDHRCARALAQSRRIILLCGRYEGVDERVAEALADEELAVGDAVLTGGELPALVVVDAVARFVPGVVGRGECVAEDSFEGGILRYPQYTRPPSYRGLEVPDVLRSGDHEAIARWRRQRAIERTRVRRPELLGRGERGSNSSNS